MSKNVRVKLDPHTAFRVKKFAVANKMKFEDACFFLIKRVLTPKKFI